MRVAHAVKMPVRLEKLMQHSERFLLILNIAKISAAFGVMTHLIACAWYAVGVGVGGNGWVRKYELEGQPLGDRYMTAAHYAITQFIGTMEVCPQNIYERVFAVTTLVATFICSAAFVSRITASMTRLQMIAEQHDRQFATLRNFLNYHNVSASLTLRVVRSARFSLEMQERNIVEKDIGLLGMISEPLRIEIHYQIYGPIISYHPFFQYYHGGSVTAMRKLCHSCIDVISLSAGDMLFTCGEAPKVSQMYFVMSGGLTYMFRATEQAHPIGVGMWACEAALWVPWVHYGDMLSSTYCSVVAVEAEAFLQVSGKFHDVAMFAASYARHFVASLNAQEFATDVPHVFDAKSCVEAACKVDQDALHSQPAAKPRRMSTIGSLAIPGAPKGTFWRAGRRGAALAW